MITDLEFDNVRYLLQNILRLPDRKAKIFRVFPVSRLLQLFSTRQLTLLPPEVWDDPFENVVLRHELFRFLKVRLYGQCWTANQEETDALWRIYSPEKSGVRVRSTVEKLFFAIADIKEQFAFLKYWIGKVQYLSEGVLKAQLEDPAILQDFAVGRGAAGLVESLLIKRQEFLHENEVRLIFCAHAEYFDIAKPTVSFSIDPNALFDEVLFDPRMPADLFQSYRSVLSSLGFAGKVEQSALYKIPNLDLKLPGWAPNPRLNRTRGLRPLAG